MARHHLVELDGEAVVFDEFSGDTHYLSELTLFVWRHACDGIGDAASLQQQLAAHFDVDAGIKTAPLVDEALLHLRHIGLLPPA